MWTQIRILKACISDTTPRIVFYYRVKSCLLNFFVPS
ncbi:hypothetical protein DFP98_1021, partial [Cohnella phaseoli]